MAIIRALNGIRPVIGKDVWMAETAVVTGDVHIGDQSSLWYHVVLRGDVHQIRIGHRTNIQDNAVIHCTYKKAATHIGDDVTVGHSAVVHGCTIGNRVLVGMGTIILDDAVVEDDVIIGAGSLVLQGVRLESGFLYAGNPVRKIKPLTPEQLAFLKTSAEQYTMYAGWYRDSET